MTLSRIAFIAGLCAAISACGNPLRSDAPAAQVYLLRAASAKPPAAPALDATVQIARPLTLPGLGSSHIMLLRPDRRLDYFAGSRWPAELSETVEALTVDTFRASGAWATVHGSRSLFPADYILQMTVHRFEADYTSAPDVPQIEVSFDCVLGRRADRQPLAQFNTSASARAEANRLGAVVAAFEQAANQALIEAGTRAADAVRTSQAPKPR